jgi:hypothetical protein
MTEDPASPAEQLAAANLLIDQIAGNAQRRWPKGKISKDDDGETAISIAADLNARVIRIQFSKPMVWLGLDLEEARYVRDVLNEKIAELEGLK